MIGNFCAIKSTCWSPTTEYCTKCFALSAISARLWTLKRVTKGYLICNWIFHLIRLASLRNSLKARIDQVITLVENAQDDSLSDSDVDMVDVQELQRSISSSNFQSKSPNSSNSSSTNLVIAPSVSACSVPKTFEKTTRDRLETVSSVLSEEGSNRTMFKLTFTREELMKRLQNLVNLSLKNSSNDIEVFTFNGPTKSFFYLLSFLSIQQLSLPGNKTTKFSLRSLKHKMESHSSN